METLTEEQQNARIAAMTIMQDVFTSENAWSKLQKEIHEKISVYAKTNLYLAKEATEEAIIVALLLTEIETVPHKASLYQFLIDYCLRLIAGKLLNTLFKTQEATRKQIERFVVRGDSGAIPRNLMRQLLKEEQDVAAEINLWKERFDKLIEAAKIWGHEVFERNENKYHIYRSLEVNFRAIVWDRQNQNLSPA